MVRKRKRKTSKRRRSRSKKKMPANVKKYFKLLGQGMSKTEARKKAGLPPKSKTRRKKWGPGHPLYDYMKKKGRI